MDPSLVCHLLLLVTVQYASALVSTGELPENLQTCYNTFYHVSLEDVVGDKVCRACEGHVIAALMPGTASLEDSTTGYLNSLMDTIRQQINGPVTRKCRRKEYRTLTDAERYTFHQALNILKNDNSVNPNKYNALASLHSGPAVIDAAHTGPNFLGWHRIYLLLMETALQEVNPNICLPFWDSSLDDELDNPSLSYVFSPAFLGGRGYNGAVRGGPFAGWTGPGTRPLSRNIGRRGSLYTATEINNILSQSWTREITFPNGDPQNGLEFHHNGVHSYIGGQMRGLDTSAYDPVFFLHHCYIDSIWEIFRDQQRTAGINPELDYPEVSELSAHAPDNLMLFTGINITYETNALGFRDYWTKTYQYDPSPSCSPSCGSKYLQCHLGRQRCVPIDLMPLGASVTPPMGIQNSFCIDGICDTRGWVYVPVKIVSVRSPELEKYDSYPVFNGNLSNRFDIYEPYAYPETYKYISRAAPKGYDKCDDGNGIGKISIQATGMNYNGFYSELAIIDQRLATSIAVGYIAVKDPRNGPVKALFRAFDSCGRICHTAFKIPGTNDYKPSSGVLDIENVPNNPQQYSQTYGQATLDTWGYSKNSDCPSFLDDDIVLSFYCDYSTRLPWAKEVITTTTPAPTTTTTTTTTTAPTTESNECTIDRECTIDVPCSTSGTRCNGERFKCRGQCNTYVDCVFGMFFKKYCPYNWSYDPWQYACTDRVLCNSHIDIFLSRLNRAF